MPAALPYPVEAPSESPVGDRCPGWQLRSAIKQHLYVLVPQEDAERSHAEHFECALRSGGKGIRTGEDLFEILEEFFKRGGDPIASLGNSEVRDRTLGRFQAFASQLDELCFSKSKSDTSLGISLVSGGARFLVKRKSHTVYVRGMGIASAHAHSRDWFELFYDSHFSPPKPFIIVLQWMVCSSVHLASFGTKLQRIAENTGFSLVRAPIGQLFPQPAPHWVWSDERETNFDRLAFHNPRKLIMPVGMDEESRGMLNAQLLQCWLKPPLSFIFLFSAPKLDFKVDVVADLQWQAKSHQSVFQRLKGWVLVSKDGLCLLALREEHVYWFENRCSYSDVVDHEAREQRQRQIAELWRAFIQATEDIFAAADCSLACEEAKLRCLERPKAEPSSLLLRRSQDQ